MFKTSYSTKLVQWPVLLVMVACVVIAFLAAQFFFLGVEIEGVLSRNVKLNITEIISKQQNARIQNTAFVEDFDPDFSRAAERADRIVHVDVGRPDSTVSEDASMQQNIYASPEYRAIKTVTEGMSLVGIIRHDSYSVAIIQRRGSSDPKVYSEGDLLSDNIVISAIMDDSVIIQNTDNRSVRMEVNMSATPLIGSGQASANFLNLPTGKKSKSKR